ncbi:hypothetical protein ACFL2T_04355, partial [Elusimicrobiota bacterium]
MKAIAYQLLFKSNDRAVGFFPPLVPGIVNGFVLAVILYFPIRMVSTGLEYPFGLALVAGLLSFLLYCLVRVRNGILVDEKGIRLTGDGLFIPWDGVRSIELDIEDDLKGIGGPVRVATVRGPGREEIRFGSLGRSGAEPNEGIRNIHDAPLLLALITARSGCEALFPPSWRDPSGT